MNSPVPSPVRFLRVALLLVLLAAQGLATAHELTHWEQGAQELCATCSLSSGLDCPIAPSQPILSDLIPVEFDTHYSEQTLKSGAPNTYRQRAPPVYL